MKLSSIINLCNITKTYQRKDASYPALHNVTLCIEAEEFVAIMGQSGAGKSTLMNIIGLLDTATSGTYLLHQTDITTLDDNARSHLRNQQIGFIFQSFFLLPRLTALENVILPTIYNKKSQTEAATTQARHLLEQVGLSEFISKRPNELSGGQQQRVAIARALMCKPKIILADEPTGALDSETGASILNLLIELNRKEKVTVIMITHDLHIAKQAQRIIHIKDGQII